MTDGYVKYPEFLHAPKRIREERPHSSEMSPQDAACGAIVMSSSEANTAAAHAQNVARSVPSSTAKTFRSVAEDDATIAVGTQVVARTQGTELAGTVTFVGVTQFASGQWMGVEINGRDGGGVEIGFGKGKKNGSVNGTVCFTCKPNRGIFVRPSVVRVVRAAGDEGGFEGQLAPVI